MTLVVSPLAHPPLLLEAHGLSVRYGRHDAVREVSLSAPPGSFTAIVGPNGCGKSTLLRALSGALTPSAGEIILGGKPMAAMRRKEAARQLAYLPQSPVAPELVTVFDLVARGRYPHQTLLRQWSDEDELAVRTALADTDLSALADQSLDVLSGGQRQRAWLALVLAQSAPLLLLDEPTTFLDIRHQVDLLALCTRLNKAGRTLVVVLHDLNLAFRHAGTVVMMRAGKVMARGPADEIVTEHAMRTVFDLDCRVMPDPESGRPMVIPRLA